MGAHKSAANALPSNELLLDPVAGDDHKELLEPCRFCGSEQSHRYKIPHDEK